MKKRGSPAPRTEFIDWPRSDPAELAKFDPETKVCTMNCGQIKEDPRSPKEHKFQCGDCYVVAPKAKVPLVKTITLTRATVENALEVISKGFNFEDGDVYGVLHNTAVDVTSVLEEALRKST